MRWCAGGLVALAAAAVVVARDESPCLIAYTSNRCEGTGVFQGFLEGLDADGVPSPVSGKCTAGAYGSIAGHHYCEELRKVNDRQCTKLNCNSEAAVGKQECTLYSGVCVTYENVTKTVGLQLLDEKVRPKYADADCAQYARPGNGWREPVAGAVAVVDPQTLNADAGKALRAALMADCNNTFLIDAVRVGNGSTWTTADGKPLNFTGVWAAGEPQAGATRVAIGVLMPSNGTANASENATVPPPPAPASGDAAGASHCKAVAYGVVEDARSSVLCDVQPRSVLLPTPAPVQPEPGVCQANDVPADGQFLAPCTNCSTYTNKDAALKACCDMPDDRCLGIVVSPLQVYSIGLGPNNTLVSADGQTFFRTAESFIHPELHPGLSPLVIVILCFLVMFTFYCAIGLSLKVQQGETNCPEVLPHYEVWTALPSMIITCCSGVCGSVCGKQNAGYSLAVADDDDNMDAFDVDNDPLPSDVN